MKKSKQKKPQPYSAGQVRDDSIIFGGFDTETDGLGGELLSVQVSVMGDREFFRGPEMLARAFEKMAQYPDPVVWYAFHAQYDWRYFLPWFLDMNYELEIGMRTETDIYQVKVKAEAGLIIMRDAAALFKPGTSLADFASSFCPELPKLEIDIAHFNPDDETHRAYAMRDVDILCAGMARLDGLLKRHFDVGVGHTAAGTAMKAWQRTIPEGVYHDASEWGENEQFVREGYYGGLVFLTSDKLHEAHDDTPIAVTVDINSSYPSVMCDYGVPDGQMARTLDYESGVMGIYRVRVTAPSDLVIPILPARAKRGEMRWQRGTFETVVTNRELIFAVKQGYVVQDVLEGIAYDRVSFPFNDFIESCKTIRKNYKGQVEEELAKLMQNSLYGKFGSRRERCQVLQIFGGEDLDGAIPLDVDARLWVKSEFHDMMRTRPEWAVFITAHARLKLMQAAYSAGIENVLYGDTDSLTVLAGMENLLDIGPDYGQFKIEKKWRVFRAIAPKVYAGQLMNGEYKGAAKGLPKRGVGEAQWRELIETGASSAEALSLSSLKVSLKKGAAPAQILGRVSSSLQNSVNFAKDLTSGLIKPKMVA